jgi:hypothetical protein
LTGGFWNWGFGPLGVGIFWVVLKVLKMNIWGGARAWGWWDLGFGLWVWGLGAGGMRIFYGKIC